MYLTKKRSTELLLWVSALFCLAFINSTTEILESIRDAEIVPYWKPVVGEFSSVIVVGFLVPCILYIDQYIPIAGGSWVKRVLVHIPLSMLFSAVHVSAMLGLRRAIYGFLDEPYFFDPLPLLVIYEYRKDLVAYVVIMLAIYAYREIIRLRLGEAQLLESEESLSKEVKSPAGKEKDQILVSKSGLYHFIQPIDIQSVEAAGNYVELHVGEDTYMLRGTMKDIESRLGNIEFARIHRSSIVKRSEIERVISAANGSKVIKLKGGREFRLSRHYGQNLSI